MVGVPGRSKGCNTCIQRKIKCDQETPLCGNCRKSSRLCTGYKRKLGYVFSRDVSLTEPLERTHSDVTVTYQGRWRKIKLQKLPVATSQLAEPPPTWAELSPHMSLCRQVSTNTVLRQQFHYVFLNDHLPIEMLDEIRPKRAVPLNWLLQLRDVAIQSPALESSIATFLAARVGRKSSDMDLIHQSRSMYVTAIERVQQALSDPEIRFSDETLAACMALFLYELTEQPIGAPNAFMVHQRGAMMILQQRGPDASASPLGHSLFLQLRAQTIVGCLIYRRETFLSQLEWIERPWKIIPKTPLDRLDDAFFAIAAIIQQFDELSHETSLNLLRDGYRTILAKLLNVESALRGLNGNFEKSLSGPLYWAELSTFESLQDDAKLGKLFPVSFHFPAFVVAQFIVTYWSGMMAAHNHIMYTYNKLAEIESRIALTRVISNSRLLEPAIVGNYQTVSFDLQSRKHGEIWVTMAKNICQSAEYFLQNKMGELGSFYMLTLLSGCNSCWKSDVGNWSREISWVAETMDRIKSDAHLPLDNLLD